jgi:hypothetical protein
MKIRYLEAMYGLGPEQTHIAVPTDAEKRLARMAKDLVGTDDLIAIYVPLATPRRRVPSMALWLAMQDGALSTSGTPLRLETPD